MSSYVEYSVSGYQFVILDYEPIFLADWSYLGKLPANEKRIYYYRNKEKFRKFFVPGISGVTKMLGS